MILKDFAIYTQQFGSLLIALLGCFLFSKRNLPTRILVLYGANSVVFQLIGSIIIYLKIKGALNLSGNIYTFTELLILLFFFYNVVGSKNLRIVVLALGIGYAIFYCFFIFDQWSEAIGPIRTLRDIIMVVCALLYFYSLMKNMPVINITQYPLFWINVAILFFFAGTFTLSISINYWIKTLGNDWILFWVFRNFFRFLFCLVVCYGLWLDFKQVKQKLATAQ